MPGSSEETGKEAPACPSRRVFVGLEMARWVCKHEDLSSDPQHLRKELDEVAQASDLCC